MGANLLSDESAEWLRRQRAQGDSVPGPLRPLPGGMTARAALVRCGTLADPLLGLYSGRLVERALASAAWEVQGTAAVRLAELNGGTLTPGRLYLAFASGFDAQDPSRLPVYWASETCCGSGSGWPGSGGAGGSGSGSGSGVEDYLWPNCCGGSLPIPGVFWLSLVNKTGVLSCVGPNSLEFLAAAGSNISATERDHNAFFPADSCSSDPGTSFGVGLTWVCQPGGTTYRLRLRIVIPSGTAIAGSFTVAGASGWTEFVFVSGVIQVDSPVRACGGDPFAEVEPVGTVLIDYGSGVVGSMDLVLSR